jgi:hypothetical protein
MAAFASTGTSDAQLNLVSQEWWTGRLILFTLSMSLQKLPVTVVQAFFRLEEVRDAWLISLHT